jgi:HNH endonuclease
MTQINLPPLRSYLPTQPGRTYRSIELCIYCGSTEELSDEHIIPMGLGGRLVLSHASCAICSSKTSKQERTCLRTMYGPLRLLYGLPSRRKRERPREGLIYSSCAIW